MPHLPEHPLHGRHAVRGRDGLLPIDAAAASDAYTPAERAAIVFAGTMAGGARNVTDEMVQELRRHFGEPEIVELCVLVAMVGEFGSINVALNIGPDSAELQVFDAAAAARASAELEA